jgi:hypothetical protein
VSLPQPLVEWYQPFLQELSSRVASHPELEPLGPISWLEEHHVSLSKTFFLPHYLIDGFQRSLRQSVKESSFPLHVPLWNPDPVITWLYNEELKTIFLTLPAFHPALLDLLRAVDLVLEQYRLPVFYTPPKFHLSLASAQIKGSIVDLKEKLDSITRQLWCEMQSTMPRHSCSAIRQQVENFHLGMGGKGQEDVVFHLAK